MCLPVFVLKIDGPAASTVVVTTGLFLGLYYYMINLPCWHCIWQTSVISIIKLPNKKVCKVE